MFTQAQLVQYRALHESAGFAPLKRTQVSLSGGDRAMMLHKFCTQDVLSKQPGEGGEAFILNVQGKIVGYVYFFVCEDAIVLDCAAGQAETLIKHLDRYVIREDVKFSDLSADRSDVLLAGPRAAEMLQTLAGISPPDVMYAHIVAQISGVTVSVSRVPFLSSGAFFVGVATSELSVIMESLASASAVSCETTVIEVCRIESGTPLYGLDITVENLPQEVNRDAHAIHFQKGCYLGQETVARIDALGHVNKLLVPVKFPDAPEPPNAGTELKQGEKTVGRVTFSTWSPMFNAPLALAYVRREFATAGTRLDTPNGAGEVVSHT